ERQAADGPPDRGSPGDSQPPAPGERRPAVGVRRRAEEPDGAFDGAERGVGARPQAGRPEEPPRSRPAPHAGLLAGGDGGQPANHRQDVGAPEPSDNGRLRAPRPRPGTPVRRYRRGRDAGGRQQGRGRAMTRRNGPYPVATFDITDRDRLQLRLINLLDGGAL